MCLYFRPDKDSKILGTIKKSGNIITAFSILKLKRIIWPFS